MVREDRDVEDLLEPDQYTALQAVLRGTSVAEAAEEVGVVHRSEREDQVVRGEYNPNCRKAAESLEQQLKEMARPAEDMIQETFENGSNSWLALPYEQSQKLLRPCDGATEDEAEAPAKTPAETQEHWEEFNNDELRIL